MARDRRQLKAGTHKARVLLALHGAGGLLVASDDLVAAMYRGRGRRPEAGRARLVLRVIVFELRALLPEVAITTVNRSFYRLNPATDVSRWLPWTSPAQQAA
jgi:DNA-binding winged helix-turn-helix (wHTH) protein